METLRTRFERFLSIIPSIEFIDNIELPEQKKNLKKADYFGMGRKIILEQKSLETDQIQKIQDKMDQLQNREDFPIFYGQRDINKIFSKLEDGEKIERELYVLITRQIEKILSKANRQIPSTEQIFNLSKTIGIVVLLNDTVTVLDPEIIVKRVSERLCEKTTTGQLRYNKIHYVILFSETHRYKNKLPVVLRIEGPLSEEIPPEYDGYIDYLTKSWAYFNGGGLGQLNSDEINWDDFKLQEKKNKSGEISKNDARIKWYNKNPYLRGLSDDEVLNFGAKALETIKPYIVKGGPRTSREELTELMFKFGDFIEESNYRGLDLRNLTNNNPQEKGNDSAEGLYSYSPKFEIL